jgi:hypothetical protein
MPNMAEDVKAKILGAFAAAPYPGDANLVVDPTGWDPECREIASAFKAKSWNDVCREMVRKYSQALPLFTPEAFRYYLPAYMIASIEPGSDADAVRDFVLANLTPPRQPTGWPAEFFHARAAQFSAAERDANKSFLELIEEQRLANWESQGLEPPPSRIKTAINYWASKQ